MIDQKPNYDGFNVTLQTTEDCNLACFVAGTKILMSDSSYKNIEDIIVGDEIIGCNEVSFGKNKQRNFFSTKVLHTFYRHAKTLTISTETGRNISCSLEHPFLTSKDAWVRAENLNIGDSVSKFNGISDIKSCTIESAKITNKQISNEIVPVYNLETESSTYIANDYVVHNCKYCYEVNKKRNDLSLDKAKKFIEMIIDEDNLLNLKTSSNCVDRHILDSGLILDFIGGDSFMRPSLIDEIIKYFQFYATLKGHRWANRWRASISTNGTLFTDEVKTLMNKYKKNISVGISIDGCPEIHDKNRVFVDGRPSMPSILKDWDWYYEWSGGDPQTKATLNRDSIPYIYESIKWMHEELKFKHINMNFIFEEMNLQDSDYEELDRQLEKSVKYILNHCDDIYVSMFSKEIGCSNCFNKDHKSDWNTGWCGGGVMPCLTPSGKIYPCFRFTKITMESGIPELIIGDVENGFYNLDNVDLIRSQTRDKISPPECRACEFESNCSWCIGGVYSLSGKFYRPTTLCKVKKYIAKWSDWYWTEYNKLKSVQNDKSKEIGNETCKSI